MIILIIIIINLIVIVIFLDEFTYVAISIAEAVSSQIDGFH